MGTISKGILGGFSGKVGTVVGANWRGKDVMRSLPKKSSRTATEDQLIQRQKFGLVTKFLAPVAPLTRAWYGQPAGYKSKRNLAVSYHIKEAIAGTYPDFTMDFPKVIITKGELAGIDDPTAVPEAGAVIATTWADNSDQANAKPTDILVAVVYNVDKGQFVYQQTAVRSAVGFDMALPANWTGDVAHCWLSFASADGKLQANSVYMGTFTLL